jgi:hypothetical protein
LSLKHAAVLAGRGMMGKNTLLVNDRFGNMKGEDFWPDSSGRGMMLLWQEVKNSV